jgi:hypothetical protein
MPSRLLILVTSLVLTIPVLFPGDVHAAEAAHHKHHLAAVLGGTWKDDGKLAASYGVEYTYRIHERFALSGWYELAGRG